MIIFEHENRVFLAAGEDADKGTERSRQRDFTLKSLVPRVEFRKRFFCFPSKFIHLLRKIWGGACCEMMEIVFKPAFSNLIYLLI